MQNPEKDNLHVCINKESLAEHGYAKRRIDQVLRAIRQVEKWPVPEEIVRLGRIELSRSIISGNGTRTLVFGSSSNSSPHLTITTMGNPDNKSISRENIIAIMEDSQRALSAPMLTPEQIGFMEDVADVAAALHSHLPMGCSLSIGSRPESHELGIPESKNPHIPDAEKFEKDLKESNLKLASFLDQIRHRFTPVLQCSIAEKSGAFRITLSPFNTYRHYPKTGLFNYSFHKEIDPLRAMALVRQFENELRASGHL